MTASGLASRSSSWAQACVWTRARRASAGGGWVVLAALVVCGFTQDTFAGQPRAGSITGAVTSPDGARLPHAGITAIERASGNRTRGTSDHLGAFVVDDLAPGVYSIVIEFPGFTPRTVHVVVAEGGTSHLAVSLEPATFREVVTVARALPRDSVEVTALRESPARDVGEMLSESAGVWKLRKGAIANDVVLRGLQSRDLNVLVDGERLYGACPDVMDPPAFHVDFSQVERVDIGRGPFDVRYQGSLGGIVNVVTPQAERGWRGQASIGAGSYGFLNPSITTSYGGARWSLLGGVSYRRSATYENGRGLKMTDGAGYRAEAAASDAFRAATAWGRAAWAPADGQRLETSVTRQQTDHTLYPYLLMDAIVDDADRLSVDYQAPRVARHLTSLIAQAYWVRVEHWMTDEYRRSTVGTPRGYSMGTEASTLTTGGRVEASLHDTVVGAEVYRRNWNAATTMAGTGAYVPQYSIPDVDIDSGGVFVEHARALGTRAAIDLGARFDRVATTADRSLANTALYRAYHGTEATSRTDHLPAGRLRVTYQVSTDLEVAGAVGRVRQRASGLRRRVFGGSCGPGARSDEREGPVVRQRGRTAVGNGGHGLRSRAHAADPLQRCRVRARHDDAAGGARHHLVRSRRDAAAANPPSCPARRRTLVGEIEGVASARQRHVDRALGETPTPATAMANLTAGLRWKSLTVAAGVSNLFDTYVVEHLSYQRDPYRSGVRVAEPGRNLFTNAIWRF